LEIGNSILGVRSFDGSPENLMQAEIERVMLKRLLNANLTKLKDRVASLFSVPAPAFAVA